MGKRKQKRKLKARTIWFLVLGYFLAGAVVATLFLQQLTAGAEPAAVGEPSMNNSWAMFPVFVLLWPIFLVVMIVKALL